MKAIIKAFFLNSETKQGLPTLTISIQHGIRNPSHSNQTTKKHLKDMEIGREKVKLSLYANDMTIYRKLWRLNTKTTGTDKWIQQSSRI